MADADREDGDALAELHAHLEATEELPLDRRAGRWIGEAQAVATDLVHADLPSSVIETRVEQIRDLLEHVEEAENPEVDAHVEAAIALARSILDEPS